MAARRRRRNPERSAGSMFALMVLAGVTSSVCTAIVFEVMNRAREAAGRAPLPRPLAPGQGTA